MNILVSGGAGFIGCHLTRRLCDDGHRVVVIDNESTGRRENVPAEARYHKGDTAVLPELERAFRGGIDAVCHIAGQVSLIRSYTDPVSDLRTNVEGAVNMLQLCIRYRVPRLIYASSMTVYGHTSVLPISETEPCNPVSYYGITKYAAERFIHTTAERTDLDFHFNVTSFRMYNVYGPRQALDNPYQGVLGIFLGNLLRGEPITIFGDGEQSRDFVYIDDVVNAWTAALNNPATHGRIFNLGSGRRLSINAVADSVLAAFHRTRADFPVQYRPARSGEQRHVEADITSARRTFGWEPVTPFEAGLAATARWARGESFAAASQSA